MATPNASIIRSGRLEIPSSIQEIMRRRLSRITDECRRVLDGAAVVGRDFDISLLEYVTKLDRMVLASLLDEAVRVSIIHALDPGVFSFAHPLLRTVIYDALAPSERLVAHLEIAESLEFRYGSKAEAHALEIAAHFIAAGDLSEPGKLVEIRAGGRSPGAGAAGVRSKPHAPLQRASICGSSSRGATSPSFADSDRAWLRGEFSRRPRCFYIQISRGARDLRRPRRIRRARRTYVDGWPAPSFNTVVGPRLLT